MNVDRADWPIFDEMSHKLYRYLAGPPKGFKMWENGILETWHVQPCCWGTFLNADVAEVLLGSEKVGHRKIESNICMEVVQLERDFVQYVGRILCPIIFSGKEKIKMWKVRHPPQTNGEQCQKVFNMIVTDQRWNGFRYFRCSHVFTEHHFNPDERIHVWKCKHLVVVMEWYFHFAFPHDFPEVFVRRYRLKKADGFGWTDGLDGSIEKGGRDAWESLTRR